MSKTGAGAFMLPLHPFYTARKAKGTFYSGIGTFHSGKGTFHSGKGTFHSGKIFFSTPEKPSYSKAFRAFCSRSKNPNI